MSRQKKNAPTLQERREQLQLAKQKNQQTAIDLLEDLADDPTDPVNIHDFKNLLFKMYFFLETEARDVLGERDHYFVWLLWNHLLNTEEWYQQRLKLESEDYDLA